MKIAVEEEQIPANAITGRSAPRPAGISQARGNKPGAGTMKIPKVTLTPPRLPPAELPLDQCGQSRYVLGTSRFS